MRLILLSILFFHGAVAWSGAIAEARRHTDGHPILKIETWKGALANPIEERIGSAPENVLDYMKWANVVDGFKTVPRGEEFSEDFAALVRQTLMKFPKDLRAKLNATVAGIFGVNNLGTTGFTEKVYDATGKKVVATIIVLDTGMLKKNGDEWATFRDSSIFKLKSPYEVKVFIDKPGEESWKTAAEFILLHELGHVLNVGSKLLPFWDDTPAMDWNRYPFFMISWQPGLTIAPRDAHKYPFRQNLKFYRDEKMENSQIPVVYSALADSTFPSLYAMRDFSDDFAESFANYVREKKFGRAPMTIEVRKNGQLIQTIPSCFSTPRCATKASQIESLWH